MDSPAWIFRQITIALLATASLVGMVGCQAIDFYDPTLKVPVPPDLEPPTEKAKVSLPAYRIEPPDILQIEMLKLVPRPPYRTEIYDVLQVQVIGTLLDQPIDGFYLVEGEGSVNLGPAYGTVRVAGMTVDEAELAVDKKLRETLAEPEVSVQLARASGMQPVTGQYVVAPDGTVNLRQYGSVHVAGRTVTEAQVAINKHLEAVFDSPDVSVDVIGYNSKVYYIVTEGANLGDNLVRVPVTGNETVLDAIGGVGGLSQLSSKEIWIARPSPSRSGCDQILPVDWKAITQGGRTETNYQILPGDRVFVAEDPLLSTTNLISRVTGPIERVLGLSSLGISTIRGSQTLGRAFNRRTR